MSSSAKRHTDRRSSKPDRDGEPKSSHGRKRRQFAEEAWSSSQSDGESRRKSSSSSRRGEKRADLSSSPSSSSSGDLGVVSFGTDGSFLSSMDNIMAGYFMPKSKSRSTPKKEEQQQQQQQEERRSGSDDRDQRRTESRRYKDDEESSRSDSSSSGTLRREEEKERKSRARERRREEDRALAAREEARRASGTRRESRRVKETRDVGSDDRRSKKSSTVQRANRDESSRYSRGRSAAYEQEYHSSSSMDQSSSSGERSRHRHKSSGRTKSSSAKHSPRDQNHGRFQEADVADRHPKQKSRSSRGGSSSAQHTREFDDYEGDDTNASSYRSPSSSAVPPPSFRNGQHQRRITKAHGGPDSDGGLIVDDANDERHLLALEARHARSRHEQRNLPLPENSEDVIAVRQARPLIESVATQLSEVMPLNAVENYAYDPSHASSFVANHAE